MLRGTPDHPKFIALTDALGLPRPHVVGLLELLWHFTSRYAPEGDVGRWSDAAIEGGCSWSGESGALVAALVSCGWLDRSDGRRLVVHDWHQHADRYVKRRLAAHGLRPLGAEGATEGRPKGDGAGAPPVPVPEPVPEPEPVGRSTPPPALPPADRAERAIRQSTDALRTRLYGLVGEMAREDPEHADPTELMRMVTAYDKPDGTRVKGVVNAALLTHERLEHSIADAEAMLAEWRAADGAATTRSA